jgi:hypothetical protein
MPSSYSPDLRIQLMANGENSGTWGTVTNTNLGTIIEDAIAGAANVDIIGATQALTAQNGLADQARCSAIIFTTSLTAPFTVYVPPVTKLYVMVNNTNYTATISAATSAGGTTPSGGLTLAIPANSSCLIRCDGTNIREQLNRVVGDLTVDGVVTTNNNLISNGNLTLSNSAFLGTQRIVAISTASPSVVTSGTSSPPSGTAITFSATLPLGSLPPEIIPGTLYYVSKINATTFNFSTSPTLTPLFNVTVAGTGLCFVDPVSLAATPAAASNSTQIATTAFVGTAISSAVTNIPVNLTNWSIAETSTTQTAAITIATPAVVTVTTAPANGTAVAFTTTGALPTGVTAGTPYYVFNRAATTYNLATTLGQSQTATFVSTTANTFTVATAPTNGQVVYFTGTTPSGVTAGVNYYVVNRTTTTFQVSLTSGGAAVTFASTGTCTATWQSIVATSGTQSGVHTENTSKMYFKYKTVDKMSIDLGGNTIASGNVTAFGTP